MNPGFWINTSDYSSKALTWNAVGCLFWLVTYITLIREIRKKKFVEMPFFIAAGNIAWEFIWSFFYHPDTGHLYWLSYQGAFALDVVIFYYLFKYGYKQTDIPEITKNFRAILITLLALWVALNYLFVRQGYDTPIGANSGYILNLAISLLYPILLLRSKDPSNFSPVVSWFKWLGTGCISVSMFIIYPSNYFIQSLCVSCFILDLGYSVLLNKRMSAASVSTITK